LEAYGKCLVSRLPDPVAQQYLTRSANCLALSTVAPPPDVNKVNEYRSCIEEQDGSSISGKWWFNRDDQNSSFRFESVADLSSPAVTKDAACAKMEDDPLDPDPQRFQTGNLGLAKSQFELWDKSIWNRTASEFVNFHVDYNINNPNPSPGGTTAFVVVYMLDSGNPRPRFYDCRLKFVPVSPPSKKWLSIAFDQDTPADDASASCAYTAGETKSIRNYVSRKPDARFGVNNGEFYAFILVTASTLQINSGLDVCWSEPTITFTEVGEDGRTRQIVSRHQFVPIM
jgi:hypothetical protein